MKDKNIVENEISILFEWINDEEVINEVINILNKYKKEEYIQDDTSLDIKIEDSLIKNNSRKAMEINRFYTTIDSVAFTFRNIENIDLLNKVLNSLDKIGAKGTFNRKPL